MTAPGALSTTGPAGGACDVVLAACAAVQGVGSALGQAASSTTTGAALAIFRALGLAVANAATAATRHVFTLLFQPVTSVDLASSTWFGPRLSAMAAVAGLVVFPMLLAATIGAIVRQDSARLARAWLVWLPVATFLTVCIIPLVSAALKVCDEMTAVVTAHSGTDVGRAFDGLSVASAALGSGVLGAVVAVLVLAGAVVLWLELLVRAAAVYITVFFLPLILAGMVWPATAHMLKRAVEVLVALILSKFVIAAVLTLGVAALSDPGAGAGGLLSGVAILLLAAFAPMALLRLIPIVEATTVAHLEGRARQPVRASADAAGRLHRQAPLVARMLGGHGDAPRAVDPGAGAGDAAVGWTIATAPAAAHRESGGGPSDEGAPAHGGPPAGSAPPDGGGTGSAPVAGGEGGGDGPEIPYVVGMREPGGNVAGAPDTQAGAPRPSDCGDRAGAPPEPAVAVPAADGVRGDPYPDEWL